MFSIVRDLENMGFTMPSDPLNVFNNNIEIKCEDDDVEEELDDGLHSFTGHSLSLKSKLDAFDSKILFLRV